jgi:hypothetical protein
MNLDKRRSFLINQARLFNDCGQNFDQEFEIALGVLAQLGLRSASPGKFDAALTLFEGLASVVCSFDVREVALGPWRSEVETGVVSPDWNEPLRILAESLNNRITHLLDYGIQHGRLEVVPSQGFHFDALFAPDDRALLDSISRVLVAKARPVA